MKNDRSTSTLIAFENLNRYDPKDYHPSECSASIFQEPRFRGAMITRPIFRRTMDSELLMSGLGLISVFFGIKWQSVAEENKSLKQQLNCKKETFYTDFINLFRTVLAAKQKPTEEELGEKMQQYNKEMILTGSNAVLQAYGDLMQSFYQDNKDSTEMLKLMGELMLAMRNELGHKNGSNTLQWFDPMRPWLKDISTLVPKKHKKYRFLKNRLRKSQ